MVEPFVKKDQSYFLIESWESKFTGIHAGMSTRIGGVSRSPFTTLNLGLHVQDDRADVIKNRAILAEKLNIPLNNWVCAEQVHGSRIKKLKQQDKGKGVYSLDNVIKGVDGLYTFRKEIFLTAGFADCVPLFFYAPKFECIGIAHAGWKGTVENIVQSMVKTWEKQEGIPVSEIYTAIGPSICEKCYQVDDHVIDQVKDVLIGLRNEKLPYKDIGNGQYLLNLQELNKQLMIQAGISTKNIEMTRYCTSCDNNLFFSHRKEKGKTGRMFGFISQF